MTELTQIQKAVEQLSEDELRQFRAWFDELQARLWDEQIERDIQAGKLDWLRDEALAEHRAGAAESLDNRHAFKRPSETPQ
jgi:multidrug resistance efflux pump